VEPHLHFPISPHDVVFKQAQDQHNFHKEQALKIGMLKFCPAAQIFRDGFDSGGDRGEGVSAYDDREENREQSGRNP
jgi:hypothetical protein